MILVTNKMKRISGLTWGQILTFASGNEEQHRKTVRIDSLQAEIWTLNLTDIKQEWHPINHDIQY
jgi:hypothetical protein